MSRNLILAIETSCDETAVAVSDARGVPLVSSIASQIKIHAQYGGVVPELASRNHSLDVRPLCVDLLSEMDAGIDDIAAVAATAGPGLASALLVGNTFAKSIAVGLGVPYYAVNHLEGHLLSPFIHVDGGVVPHVGLVVSGGHTLLIEVKAVGDYRLLGSTKDDAAGEAFDKVGRLLGLPYPGGPEIARLAAGGNRKAFAFPRSMLHSGDFEFSFSGLKTSARYALDALGDLEKSRVLPDFCASFEEAIVDVLVKKLVQACRSTGARVAALSGGVSCNNHLREQVSLAGQAEGFSVRLADPVYTTDNAAMIAYVAAQKRENGHPSSPLDSDIDPNLQLHYAARQAADIG